jgi:hypothetical protein
MVFVMDTHYVLCDGVARPLYRYQEFFPGGKEAGELIQPLASV